MVIPERVSIITNYGDWEDRLIMKGLHLNVSVRKININKDLVMRVSDERGLSIEIPCENIEIVEVQKTKWEFEGHIYFFTFGGLPD